jgi:hypothetical protein
MSQARKAARGNKAQRADRRISATDMAKRLGITAQAVGLWASRPGAPVEKDGRHVWLLWPDFARWREQELIARALKDEHPTDYEAARTRKALAEAESAELDLAQRRGEMVTIEDFGKGLGRILDLLVARLRSLPPRLCRFGAEVEVAAEEEVEDIITELHNFDEDVLEMPDDDTGAPRDDESTAGDREEARPKRTRANQSETQLM